MALITPEAIIKNREYEIERLRKTLKDVERYRARDRENTQPMLREILRSKLPEIVDMVKRDIADKTTWSLQIRTRNARIDDFPWVSMLCTDKESREMISDAIFAESSPDDMITGVNCHITASGSIVITFR